MKPASFVKLFIVHSSAVAAINVKILRGCLVRMMVKTVIV